MACAHLEFRAEIKVNRLEDTGAFFADIRIWCIECGLPFEFPGLPAGLRHDGATVSLDAQELRLPIKPKGSKVFPAVPGFMVRAS